MALKTARNIKNCSLFFGMTWGFSLSLSSDDSSFIVVIIRCISIVISLINGNIIFNGADV